MAYREHKACLYKKGREWKSAVMRRHGEVVLKYMGFGKAVNGNWHGYSKVKTVTSRPGSEGVL